jgi:NAD(P)-dependent dehydrogenase (short-subunit alcohol dehydrogenase family)
LILKDQVAFTIGSTKGIAAVFCKVFAQEGAKVVSAGRTAEFGEQVVAEIRAEGEEPIIDRKFIIAPGLLKNVLKAG